MIILDTNIVSEMMKPVPNLAVQTWLNQQVAETLYLSSVTIAELLFGVATLPNGKRKDALSQMVEELLALFKGRVLPFDAAAAYCYADLAATARQQGRGFPTPDGYIAAIAVSRGFLVASRDVAPYQAAGLRVLNPFEAT